MAVTFGDLIGSDFFAYVLPFLLVFALSYAFLTKIITDKSTRTIVSVIFGALVLPLGPILSSYLSKLTGTLLVIIGGLLVLIIFFEIFGVGGKSHKLVGKNEKGEPVFEEGPSIFQRYGVLFAFILIAIAGLVFVQSGGLALLGIQTSGSNLLSFLSAPVVFFIILLILMVWWMSSKSD